MQNPDPASDFNAQQDYAAYNGAGGLAPGTGQYGDYQQAPLSQPYEAAQGDYGAYNNQQQQLPTQQANGGQYGGVQQQPQQQQGDGGQATDPYANFQGQGGYDAGQQQVYSGGGGQMQPAPQHYMPSDPYGSQPAVQAPQPVQQQGPQQYFNEQTGQWEYIDNQPASYAPQQGMMDPAAPAKQKKEDRIDPSQIPRWSPEHKTDEPVKKFYTRSGSSPPPSTHPFIAVDEGNCSPRFIRMSTNYIANEAELVEQTKLCIGAIIQPLAELGEGEETPPVRDFGEDGPIRCNKCRAYINPFFRFVDNGKSFICNMCQNNNPVPDFYYCNLDPKGFRRDRNERPELCRGTVDFVAPPDYCEAPVTDPCYLFVVDVSYSSLVSGLVDCALECIRASVETLADNPRTRVGIITYDQALYFYSAKDGKGEPRLDVVSDVDDAFVPVIPETVMLQLSDQKQLGLIDKVLDMIAKVHLSQNSVTSNNCTFGAAAQAGALLLEKYGGKMMLLVSSLCDVGTGKLEARNDIKVYNTDKEATLLVPRGSNYENLATWCAKAAVSVDIFACAHEYLDLATIGSLSRTTGGQIYYYNGFNANKDGEAFHRDMYRNISRYTAFQGLMVIRTSEGLKVSERYGNYFAREADEMELPVIHCDSSFGVMMTHESKLTTKEACIQTALLYTAPDGKRRIRIHTLSLPVTSALCNLFRHADLDTIINLSLKQGINQILYKTEPKNARRALTQACIDSLFVYRKYCSTQHSPGQLILPEPLKLLPLATLGMIKHDLFHTGTQVDQRVFLTAFVQAMPTYVACSFIDPCLFSLTEIPDYACIESSDGRVFLPPVLKLSSDSINSDGVYLLDDGLALHVWIGETAKREVTDQLFGMVQQTEDGPSQLQILYDENADAKSLNARVWTLITQLRKNCPSFKTISIITRNSHTGASLDESQFFDHLIEDAARRNKWNPSDLGSKKDSVCNMSYIDFLCHIHKKIQDKFY
eukprot:CAMPEP_0184498410 /NCGR_PEP_ID=MMETSP0113_2-20130426/38873_1 /TAXON_ID=91329 /ORGANISM="Norrisiella sphaerica, Strain BC52" /LENGTH=983 /DNA_ID=CAMNT_0026885903 /DNA_START=79 /DNA_END=3030 /DNA_ORIENTATION=-